ncbi:probable potassium transport system protein kup 1 [Vulpes lagopus]|uniref:probable potassium transport system protein kup 1 n=1 Tax=Vulpes lagopus TaxID=494514 RepID=UPI001BC97066|nr:probable potassium transport system protein kup 1 [Vulpes lagopus]
MLVVTLKYVILVLRADNRGEGGILALASLAAHGGDGGARPRRAALLLMGVAGATLFYGDSVITPASPSLGAVEGLQVVAPARWGTGTVGKGFRPGDCCCWFGVLAVSGLVHFLQARGWKLFAADGSHCPWHDGGRSPCTPISDILAAAPIQLAWTVLVLAVAGPELPWVRGALLMSTPAAVDNPFFRMFPQALAAAPWSSWPRWPAVIASQAVISGAYSMTRQAIQLGFLPRLSVRFTSAQDSGPDLHCPRVNSPAAGGRGPGGAELSLPPAPWPGAYGYCRDADHAADNGAGLACGARALAPGAAGVLTLAALPFAVIDQPARLQDARSRLFDGRTEREQGIALGDFLQTADIADIHRAQRIALYLVNNPTMVPNALLHNMKHNQVLHKQHLIVHVRFHEEPWVRMDERIESQSTGP